MLLRCTYAGRKYPYICTLSISTNKIHSAKVEYESTVVIYIPTKQYKYLVIIEHNLISHQYYITKGHKSMIYKEIYNEHKLVDAHELQKKL